MPRLASPVSGIRTHYEVVVVGSGYGGGIAASRMARAGRQVCVLERGKEFQPGEYPNSPLSAAKEFQIDVLGHHQGSSTGLYDLRVNKDINVFIGCGLGGTSLVNANVSLPAEPRVFEDTRWPQEIRDDADGLLEKGYAQATAMLKPVPYPDSSPTLPKLAALQKSGDYLAERTYRPPINVTFEDGVNHVGVEQSACTLCGDCVTGCNYGAKNTVLMNYLPDAKNHGAEIFTRVSVRSVSKRDDRWLVRYQLVGMGREGFDAPTLFLTADVVILSAGTLGSTEILLRSGKAGLPLSDKLGTGFTGNGDVLAFGYNNDVEINGVGFGDRSPEGRDPVGPCITGVIDIRRQESLDDGMVIEEGSIPGGLAGLLPPAMAIGAKLVGRDTDRGFRDYVREQFRVLTSLIRGPYHGAMRNTQTYLVMAHDDGKGRMRLEDDRLRVDWPDVGKQPIFERADQRLFEVTKALGGKYVKNPTWTDRMGHSLITVHPLGGCVMAEDATNGAVNHKGQVFSSTEGTDVHEGLYVADGSVIPRPLGVNPLLTISAVAERTCAFIAADRGWSLSYNLPSAPAKSTAATRIGIRFTETMRGSFSTKVLDDFERAEEQGARDSSPFEFTLTIASDDLDRMLSDESHQARMIGSVTAPALSSNPLTATDGIFNLFVKDPDQVNTRRMRYRMKMASEEGRAYYFEGFKAIHDDPGFDMWADTTTLYITVHDGENSESPVLGKGILKIEVNDFRHQMTNMQVTGATGLTQQVEAQARFGKFFAGVLYETYGGIFIAPKVFAVDAPPRQKRVLRTDAPEVHFFKTDDDAQLLLTRYQGGSRGPVILSHGLGVSSKIFAIDTIETNLLEYLFEHGYDVWLLDYRASIDLPASAEQFTADDVATKDYPAAVNKVREVTGADSVDFVVHCFGSTTFFMAMLAGLQGVRSAVCSQIAVDIRVPPVTRVKSGVHLPELLSALGVESMTALADSDEGWLERLYDRTLSLYPFEAEERCDSATCHRITFIYAPLYEHDQLNEATHSALHEMFGIANMGALDHLAELVRKGHLVAADGAEAYVPHLDRLAIPITFIHGKENACFLPDSTQITYDLLSERNGAELYSREVIPDYGHIDCIFGKKASTDVFPVILKHLDKQGA